MAGSQRNNNNNNNKSKSRKKKKKQNNKNKVSLCFVCETKPVGLQKIHMRKYMYVCMEEAKYACNYAERERKREMLWADKRKVSHKLSSA